MTDCPHCPGALARHQETGHVICDCGSVHAPAKERPVIKRCILCDTRAFRRGLCRSCHRKLSACGIPLPPAAAPRSPVGRPRLALALWVRRWPAETRAVLLAALREAA